MDDAISLGVGEPDFITPWHIRDAGIYSLKRDAHIIRQIPVFWKLREEICNYLKKFDLSYNSDEVLVTVGRWRLLTLL